MTFSLLVFHIWLCFRRLKAEEKDGVELGQYLYEIYNHDVKLKVSKVGIVDSIEESNASLKLVTLSTLEILAQKFSANHSVFSMCLASVTKGISLENLVVSSRCLKTTSALINVLGCMALAELPFVDKLGGFLNPYVGDILELMVLHPTYVSRLDLKLKVRANLVRKLLIDKIPPLLKVYSGAVKFGYPSWVIAFEMLTDLVSKMDRALVSGYYGKIFE
ncbi:hypothetical protein DITRI_Ditri06bG0116700 [Diplodiscus trichospermus]